MPNIYDQHAAAFKHVQAFIVLKGEERVASVAIKFPKDGAGRLYAYVHWFGQPMTRGHANGYGYDKRSAAVEVATRKIDRDSANEPEALKAFVAALAKDNGHDWTRRLEHAGFRVLQAV